MRGRVVEVRQLGLDDLKALVALRAEALDNHPLAFGATRDEDRLLSASGHTILEDLKHAAVFGAFERDALQGMVGLVRAAGAKRRHKAIVWGMYVRPTARRSGIGRALLAAVIAHARTWIGVQQLHLSVTDMAADARRLYLGAGFTEWGREPRSLEWQGEWADEAHLTLRLE
jgi:GNAT superfamily N-acetyltransferase